MTRSRLKIICNKSKSLKYLLAYKETAKLGRKQKDSLKTLALIKRITLMIFGVTVNRCSQTKVQSGRKVYRLQKKII